MVDSEQFECSHNENCDGLGEHVEKRTREWAREEAEEVVQEELRKRDRKIERLERALESETGSDRQ
ncbi:hypothetical protein [Natrinema salsiterrestre]|uniref:Uncharacterized protein n=1 Tax=Natrinema salsiterrestre TaxID=2950540 RepID=A0A9Q4L8A2_9EURY|nr:hypothetical protein [Natrinema salsiterrestre]MDF9748362.1 hypothetical protein [Natrinema salsiterrestre]